MMKKFHLISVVIVCLSQMGCATSPTHTAANGYTQQLIDDRTIAFKTSLAIAKEKTLWKQSHVNVVSYDNVLLLVGQTPTDTYKKRAGEIAQQISKTYTIYNQLEIAKPLSMSQRSKDAWITTQVKAKLLGNSNVKGHQIKVVTENSIVYLIGKPSESQANTAINLTQQIKGVQEIIKIFNI